ncbi:U-box domain-containing protein 35 isoform X2 [Lathyrus oleraceus]|nr:U-box domain-containing protein 35-like isoform X2 [Pisum sativum]
MAFKREIEWQTNHMILPFKSLCEQRKVHVDVVVIESDDVVTAIAEEVTKDAITKLVVGASSSGIFRSKHKGMSAKISVSTPTFCTVYAVSKGKLSIRQSDTRIDGNITDNTSEISFSSTSSSNYTSTTHTDSGSVASYAPLHPSPLATRRVKALSGVEQTLSSLDVTNHSRGQSLDLGRKNAATSSSKNSDVDHYISQASSSESISDTESRFYDQNSAMFVPQVTNPRSPNRQENINLELQKLRIELRHAQGMHAVAQSENTDASQKLNELNKRRLEESMKMKEIIAKEEMAKELANQEREKYEAAAREAEYLKQCAEREAAERKGTELKAIHAAKEKEKLEDALSGSTPQYRVFTWDEIVSATSSFSENLRIGMGAYGMVYKCTLHHTTVAVKVIHSNGIRISKQFEQELEILSRIRHPNLLLLLGACPDHGCLVYEYMENGNLEDRLLQKNGNSQIPWFVRFRIAWEIASALSFLHSTKPQPIIHRDLKPANILLGGNLVSKIGDVGLSTILDSDNLSAMYKDTAPVGTLSYIDPEYQRSGLISTKSDVYAFGLVMLQLLTAKPAIALTHIVETAIDDGNLADMLDPKAGSWPIQETLEIARLALSCAEMRRKDRPDLNDHVLPMLERLKEVADKAQHSASIVTLKSKPPNHFICPILQDVMDDPCVAADGYTYDRKAIEKWLLDHDKSPMTNMALPHKYLIPNYTLLSAILEWKT